MTNTNPTTTTAALTPPDRPLLALRTPPALILLATLALGASALLMFALLPGLHVAFLLGGAGKGSGGALAPFIARVQSMSGPVAVLGAAFATLGGVTGGALLALGHPHGARMLGRVAVGAFVIAVVGTIVN
jgi:hypothetical protein